MQVHLNCLLLFLADLNTLPGAVRMSQLETCPFGFMTPRGINEK